jgi:hypothetical protein
MYKVELRVPEVRLKSAKEVSCSIYVEDKLLSLTIPSDVPLEFELQNPNTNLIIVVKSPTEIARCNIDLSAEL